MLCLAHFFTVGYMYCDFVLLNNILLTENWFYWKVPRIIVDSGKIIDIFDLECFFSRWRIGGDFWYFICIYCLFKVRTNFQLYANYCKLKCLVVFWLDYKWLKFSEVSKSFIDFLNRYFLLNVVCKRMVININKIKMWLYRISSYKKLKIIKFLFRKKIIILKFFNYSYVIQEKCYIKSIHTWVIFKN